MELIKINDKTFEPYVSAEELNQITERMASEVYQDLQESRPIFIAILNANNQKITGLAKGTDPTQRFFYVRCRLSKALQRRM